MQEREQALLFIRRGADAAHLIAGGVDRLPELTLIQRLVGQNDGLALRVGGGNLFDVQRAADASFTWASHMEQAIPDTCTVV